MNSGLKYKLADQRGASAVEFAIILPLLVVFVFGIIEFGIIYYNKAMVTNASREGARKGIVFREPTLTLPQMESLIGSVVDNYCSGKMITFGPPSTPECLSPGDAGGPPSLVNACPNHNDQLKVEVWYQYDFLIVPNFLGGVLPNSITIKAVTEMRCE